MATSLTNNVLTFNNGSIKDVRNDLNAAFPISINVSRTFNWSSASSNTVTISGSPGQVVYAAVRGVTGQTLRITSDSGAWVYNTQGGGETSTYAVSLNHFLWMQEYTLSVGTIDVKESSITKNRWRGIVAYRLY